MSIYDIDFATQIKILIRDKYRKPKFLNFLSGLIYPLDWLRQYRLKNYKYGTFGVSVYDPSVFYTRYSLVIWNDGGVYMRFTEPSEAYPNGTLPADGYSIGMSPPSKYWIKVANSFVGFDERRTYSCSILSLEYMLNRWFATLNPIEYPTGFWPAKYPDAYDYDTNKPLIWIEQKAVDSNVFFVGTNESSSSLVGEDDQVYIGLDFVGLDDSITANVFSFIIHYPESLIGMVADNESYSVVLASNAPTIDERFYQIESLVNKHKHVAMDHGYKSY
jgi:hypothetical protein